MKIILAAQLFDLLIQLDVTGEKKKRKSSDLTGGEKLLSAFAVIVSCCMLLLVLLFSADVSLTNTHVSFPLPSGQKLCFLLWEKQISIISLLERHIFFHIL